MKCRSLDLRRHLVAHARAHGIKPTARAFGCSVLSVRKWLRRHAAEGLAGLHDRSRAPRHCPHKTAPEVQRRILAQRARTPRFGANRLRREFGLPASAGAIQRVLRQHGLARRRRKAHQRKADLGSEFQGNAMTPREVGFDHPVQDTFHARHRRIASSSLLARGQNSRCRGPAWIFGQTLARARLQGDRYPPALPAWCAAET